MVSYHALYCYLIRLAPHNSGTMRLPGIIVIALFLGGCGVEASSGFLPFDSKEPEVQVSDFHSVSGTRFLIASLRGERDRSSYTSRSYYSGAALNHLFYDMDTRSARWLLPGFNQRIVETRPLTSTPESTTDDENLSRGSGGSDPVRAFLYLVVGEDTNGDGKLDGDDQFELAASDPGGAGYSVLVESADRFLGAFRVDEAHTLLIYEKEGVVLGVEVDVENRTVTRQVDFQVARDTAPAA